MLTLIKKYKSIAIIALLIGTIYGSYTLYQTGYKNGHNAALLAAKTEKIKAISRAIQQANKINEQNEKIAQDYWQAKLAVQPKIKTIEKRIIKYVQTIKPGHCDIDDDELRILNDLIDTANGNPENNQAKN